MNTEKKQTHLIVITLILSFSFSLAIAEWVLSYQRKSIENSESMDAGMILYDADLGWRLKPYWSGKHHHYDYDVSYDINADGFRGKLSAKKLTGSKKPFVFIGDSFSFGLGVNDEQTFTALLNTGVSDDSAHEAADDATGKVNTFLNYSVPGYSTDQQLLLLKKHGELSGKNIVLVIYLGNDVFDNMLSFPLQAEHGKPYFDLAGNQLVLKNTPVPLTQKPAAVRDKSISSLVLGNHYQQGFMVSMFSAFEISRRLNLFQADIQLTEQLLESQFSASLTLISRLVTEMDSLVKTRQGSLSVVLLPGRSYVESQHSVSAQYQEYFREVIKMSLQQSSVTVIDLATHLKQLTGSAAEQLYYPNEGHLTAKGHKAVAEYLRSKL